jgi:hypothetical protein
MEVGPATAEAFLARLDAIAGKMTEAIVPFLEAVTPETYRAVLSVCFHYTRTSGTQLERSAELAPSDDLHDFFAAMAEDERHHYRLAEADLAAFGESVSACRPAAVDRFADYWNAITHSNYFEFLGATYVLENLAEQLREQVARAMAVLGLNRRQSRFVRTHLEADVEHGQRIAKFCARYGPEHATEILAGAEAASRYWADGVRMFLIENGVHHSTSAGS